MKIFKTTVTAEITDKGNLYWSGRTPGVSSGSMWGGLSSIPEGMTAEDYLRQIAEEHNLWCDSYVEEEDGEVFRNRDIFKTKLFLDGKEVKVIPKEQKSLLEGFK